jgi:hypothetical protein
VSGELRLPFSARVGRATDLAAISTVFERARSEEWATRLADKDVTLWSRDAEVQAKIANRLGWLDAPAHFTEQVPALEAFGEKVRDAGFTTAIVAGDGWILPRSRSARHRVRFNHRVAEDSRL